MCGELRFPWRALYRERCGLQSQVSRRLAFELACSNTPSRVAGAVAFGRMLAYAALRLPTTSTGTYGTGVLAKSVYADIPVLVGRHRYAGPGPRPSRSCPRRRCLHFVSALNQPVCAAPVLGPLDVVVRCHGIHVGNIGPEAHAEAALGACPRATHAATSRSCRRTHTTCRARSRRRPTAFHSYRSSYLV